MKIGNSEILRFIPRLNNDAVISVQKKKLCKEQRIGLT